MVDPRRTGIGAGAGSTNARVDGWNAPELRFAVQDLTEALRNRGHAVSANPAMTVTVYFSPLDDKHPDAGAARRHPAPASVQAEGFSLRRTADRARPDRLEIVVYSRDAAGAMYGGLELAEQVRIGGLDAVVDTDRNPYMALRGTKFNIPLDLRTPSYSDMSDSAQANIATVWDFGFWRAYLDQLARDRYNFVSLWNLHPFPSMVKLADYPGVALDDVWRTTVKFDEDYSTRTVDLLSPAMLAKKEVVKTLTIDEKIAFWRQVMEYARDRNIRFHVVTWNIFTYGVDGQYGITDAMDNPRTRAYFRASVREMFRTYPLLAGIGLTAGENMGEVKMYSGGVDSFDAKEDWLFATYGQGVLDAARSEPQRRFRLIHRQHETRAQDIAKTFEPVIVQPNVEFVFSFKYAQAHVLSSTRQSFHREYLKSLGPHQTLWTLRNDDALLYRWAAPDFVREFVRNIPRENTAGMYIGSDMWVWGREFLARRPKLKGQLEIDKHWLHFLLWGRMAYDPTLDNERLAALVGRRFPGSDARRLLSMWQDASMIYPLVTGFHWANFDFQWYIEGCRSRPGPARTASGFHSVETFITQPVHPDTDNISIPRYVAGVLAGQVPEGTTPLQLADRLDQHADRAFDALVRINQGSSGGYGEEYSATLSDVVTMAELGKYYAAKIRGATELALYRQTRDAAHQKRALDHLTAAQGFWLRYTGRSRAHYLNPLWTNRVGIVDWDELNAEVANDMRIARVPAP
jgi:hypothetical protein